MECCADGIHRPPVSGIHGGPDGAYSIALSGGYVSPPPPPPAGVAVGTWWATRLECCADGIHRPTVAGIHGGPDGAYSIALSGG